MKVTLVCRSLPRVVALCSHLTCCLPGTENYFYYNVASGEAQWKEPVEFIAADENFRGVKEEDADDDVLDVSDMTSSDESDLSDEYNI